MKILIAEDDPISRTLLQRTLSGWGHEVVAVANGDDALKILQNENAPPLALLDWMMPGMDGPDVCKAVRLRERYPYLILLTARSEKDDLVQGLESGADDYVVKPFDPLELKARLKTGIRIVTLQEELIASRDALRVQASRDFLTGAWNRRAIMEILQAELSRTRRENGSLGLVMVDIDHFKKINDRFGHRAGDEVLREVTRRLAVSLRPYDLVGRWGGEEFLIVVPNSNRDGSGKLAERLRQRLAEAPISVEGNEIAATASFGVAVFEDSNRPRLEDLVHQADETLYEAKKQGRNRVVLSPSAHGVA